MKEEVIRICTEPISDQCPHFITPENTRKAKASGTFRGYIIRTMFKNGLEIDFMSQCSADMHLLQIGPPHP